MDWTASFQPVWSASLLDAESTPFEEAIEAVDADLVARDPVGLIAAARSDAETPLVLLPYLADERSVDEFDGTWSEERRRLVVRASFRMHQVKGTRPALDHALRPLGYDVRVVEWFERDDERPANTFRLRLSIGALDTWTERDRRIVIRVVNGAKNAHTKLEAIEMRREVGPVAVFSGGILRSKRTLRVGQMPKLTTLYPPDALPRVGVAFRQRRILRIHQS